MEFEKKSMLKNVIVLVLSGMGEFLGVHNLVAYVEKIPFPHGCEYDSEEIRSIIFELFESGLINITHSDLEGSLLTVSIKSEGLSFLKKNLFFKFIAENFP